MEYPSSFKSSLASSSSSGLANITNNLNGIKLAKSTSLKQSIGPGGGGGGGLSAACSFNDLKKFARTPNKSTALQVAAKSAKKKTPHGTIINDRYIPNRLGSNMEASYHLLHNKDKENSSSHHYQQQLATDSESSQSSDPSDSENRVDSIKRRIIIDACHGLSETSKVLNLHSKLGEMSLSTSNLSNSMADQSVSHLTGDIKSFLPSSSATSAASAAAAAIKRPRHIPIMPERILDAPDFKNDYYLNLLDWSPTNNIAVALDKGMYVWSAETGEIAELFSMTDMPGGGGGDDHESYISSCVWCHSPAASLSHILAVGTSQNNVELWDINKMTKIRSMQSHVKRVGSMAWNAHLVTSGSRSGEIHHHDIRVASHHVGTLRAHTEEVCGLKWSPDGRYLASGGNDNLVAVWDAHDSQPLHRLTDHTAAVKALAWCPFKTNMLASGGGTACQTIKLWNATTGTLLSSTEARSQISSILWSKRYKELVSGHGLEQNQLTIWKYQSADNSNHSHNHMKRVCDLKGHTDRVLGMSMSPDGETVASISADETLRLWKCFAADTKQTGSGGDSSSRLDTAGYTIRKSSSHNSLTRCIR